MEPPAIPTRKDLGFDGKRAAACSACGLLTRLMVWEGKVAGRRTNAALRRVLFAVMAGQDVVERFDRIKEDPFVANTAAEELESGGAFFFG